MNRSAFTSLAAIAAVCGSVLAGGTVVAQEMDGFHEFTGKNGQKLVARLLRVSEDRRSMSFLRQDGVEFETPITLFSLDDQQFVREWLEREAASPETPPATAPTQSVSAERYRLEVSISKTAGESGRRRTRGYTYETKETVYRIAVRNLSRETLQSAKLEYALVWEDAVVVFETAEGEPAYVTNRVDGDQYRVKQDGAEAIAGLRFNGEAVVETKPAPIDRILYSSNEVMYEDSLLGVKARVVAADGTVLVEAHSGGAAIAAMTWDQIAALGEPRTITRN